MRIGIFGGTFNPPHMGHLRLAEEASQIHGLEKVVFVPSFIPPHKKNAEIASAHHRLEMARLSCADNPAFEISDIEISLQGTSYTVNTLTTLSETHGPDIYFIMGTDSLREIHTWMRYQELFSLCNFIVVTRPDISFEESWKSTPDELRAHFRKGAEGYAHESSRVLISSQVEGLNISSTMIRNLVLQGRSIRYLVMEPVRRYIETHKLFRNDSSDNLGKAGT